MKIWKPKKDETYFYINENSGKIESRYWWGTPYDEGRVKKKNCFKTWSAARLSQREALKPRTSGVKKP